MVLLYICSVCVSIKKSPKLGKNLCLTVDINPQWVYSIDSD
nr:MAG TPA: hypothetical protein [Caudoviricetes sp.]